METINQLFGLHVQRLELHQMVIRAITIFFVSLIYLRVAGIKTIGTQNPFDQLTKLVLGAIMGRAVVAAEQPFFESILAVLVIVLLHRLLAWLSFKSKKFGSIFKGKPILLFDNGQLIEKNLSKTYTTRDDIQEALHSFSNTDDFAKMKSAYLERSGEISIIKKELK